METVTKRHTMNGKEKKYPKIIQKIMDVTPAIAQKFLLKNNNNRPFKVERIDEYAEQMRKGLWVINNDDICLDWDGFLNNGQHRMAAVVKSGKTVKMSFKFGVDPMVFDTMDSGKKRTSGDAFSIAGIKNGDAKSAIVKFYLQFKQEKFFIYIDGKHRLQHNDILAYGMANKKRMEEVYSATKSIFKGFRAIPIRYLGAFYWKFSDINQESANDFFEKYRTGLGITENHPVYVLRRKLMEDATSLKKVPFGNKIQWFVEMWNAYRQKRTVTNIRTKYKKGEDVPRPI